VLEGFVTFMASLTALPVVPDMAVTTPLMLLPEFWVSGIVQMFVSTAGFVLSVTFAANDVAPPDAVTAEQVTIT
jgi:hypothetical protein